MNASHVKFTTTNPPYRHKRQRHKEYKANGNREKEREREKENVFKKLFQETFTITS